MKTKMIRLPDVPEMPRLWISRLRIPGPELLLLLLLLIWFILPLWLQDEGGTTGTVDKSIWLLILLGFITFLLILGLAWWLLNRFWTLMRMPALEEMVSQFKTLSLCQQLSFYLLSFALLLLAAINSIACIL